MQIPNWKICTLLISLLCVIVMQRTWLQCDNSLTGSGSGITRLSEKREALSNSSTKGHPTESPTANRSHGGSAGGGIPRILHYVFKNELAFEAYKPLIRSCLDQNPGWQVFLWRDSDSEKLIQQYYKHFADKYRSYGDRLEKSDSIRYMILHKFGGVYLDMDIHCLKPFDLLLQPFSTGVSSTGGIAAFLGEERREQTRLLYGYSFYTMNSLMGSGPGHPFFHRTISRMQSMPSVNHARLSTGPDFLTNLYHSWVNSSEGKSHPVHVFPARLVSPLMDTSMVNWPQRCEPYFKPDPKRKPTDPPTWGALACSELVAKGWRYDDTDNSTIAVHRFLHLGYGSQNGLRTFHLFKEFPRFKTHCSV